MRVHPLLDCLYQFSLGLRDLNDKLVILFRPLGDELNYFGQLG